MDDFKNIPAAGTETATVQGEIAYRGMYGLVSFAFGAIMCLICFALSRGVYLKDVCMVASAFVMFGSGYVSIMVGHPRCNRDKCLLAGAALIYIAGAIALGAIAHL